MRVPISSQQASGFFSRSALRLDSTTHAGHERRPVPSQVLDIGAFAALDLRKLANDAPIATVGTASATLSSCVRARLRTSDTLWTALGANFQDADRTFKRPPG
jgi:hypothetical protein